MKDFYDFFHEYDFQSINNILSNNDKEKVIRVLKKDNVEYADFLYLLSDAAEDSLQEIAVKARDLTIKRFGKVINFYAPIYLSNECSNSCTYCGFNRGRNIKRVTLDPIEYENEMKILKSQGFDNILLLTGESQKSAGVEYIRQAVMTAKKYFTYIGLEVYPMSTEEYSSLVDAGASGLTIYQETYDVRTYDEVHPSGRKKDFKWRITTPDRAFMAGFRKVGLGSLLGIFNWKYEAAMLGLHASYLRKKYWKGEVSLSVPRINPVETDFSIPYPVSDRNLVWMISALRILLPESGFVLSTREKPEFRNNLINLCITQISAGSRTSPGGYSGDQYDTQFEVSDKRNLDEMMKMIRDKGYDPVLKDWEINFSGIK
jgi:2-iminoacetate synthase